MRCSGETVLSSSAAQMSALTSACACTGGAPKAAARQTAASKAYVWRMESPHGECNHGGKSAAAYGSQDPRERFTSRASENPENRPQNKRFQHWVPAGACARAGQG